MNKFLLTAGLTLACLSAHAELDLNRAREMDLDGLKGVGPALSARIIKAREVRAFSNWEDLQQRVKGVGPALSQTLSDQGARIEGKAWLQAK
jgi:competence protein ComEA